MIFTFAGFALALLPVLVFYGAWRFLRALLGLLRAPWQRLALLGARLSRLKPVRTRALAREEGPKAAALAEEVSRLRADLRIAQAERDLAVAIQAPARRAIALPWPRARDERFQQAKQEFARLFHPDRLAPDDPERTLRTAIFRDYWRVLRRIERG